MRYEDASGTDSFSANEAAQSSTLSAHNDADVILAGKFGPATGNAITGAGTVSGSAGADSIASGHAAITAIQGAGGTDTTFSGGHLQIAGQYGVLTMDAQGNYSYVRNHGTPNGVSDVFNYTLSANDGATDIATLTINIGKTPTVIQANAVQVVPGPNGVVTLPAGVELSDIHVVGRNLVIDMPDGTQMIIVDGAVFVPQLVLGTVEVPSTNLAALLIDSEPQPAAGPPQSSGGNFEVPVPPLDPGEPLGDLIPPTELNFPPFEAPEVVNAEEEEDNPVLITDLTPSLTGGDVTVDEDDLPAGSDTSKESLTSGGTFTISAPDGVQDLTVGSLNVIVDGVFQAGASMTTPLGNVLTITGYNAATGVISYTYTLGAAETHATGAGENSLFEDFLVTLTDTDGDVDTDTLSANIIDDVPTANNDATQLIGGGPISVTVDVDTNDVPGADGTASRVFTSLTGTYGNLVLNADGTQTYTLSASGIAALNNTPPGSTLTDTFNYTLTDGDGDSDPAALVITLVGNDHPVLITGLTPAANGGDVIVDEDDLADGSDTSKESLTVTGDFTISAPDGVDDLTVGGVQVIINGVFQAGATGLTPLGNTLAITGYNAATGVVSYSYTLNDNEAHPTGNGQNSIFENLSVSLTDVDGDGDTDTLSVQIVDDVPTANDDAFVILEGDADNAISFDVDLNDVPGADGTASRIFTSLVGTYGNIVVNPDGTQTYTLNATGIAAINALAPGATLTDNFSYTLTDGDGDSDPANVVITLTGTDDPPVITNLNPQAAGGEGVVDEDDLPDGSDTTKESTTITGDFTISAADGVDDLTVDGVNVIINGVFQAGAVVIGPLGNPLTFTGYNAATGVVSYSYTLLDNENHPNANGENSLFEQFTATLTDTDGDVTTATGAIEIIDDVPVANDDAFSIFEGDADNAISFDVDLNDVPGADGTASRIFTSLVGTYGDIVVNPDGTQTYTLNATGIAAINALAPGATLTDNFSYTLTDGDGDSDPANVVITLTGTDDPPVITGLTPSAQGGDAIVDEDDLADGSDTSKESLTTNGDFTISAPDGVNDLTVGGFNVIIDGVFQAGSHVTPLGNTLTFISYNAATGVISYSYTLLDNETHPNANGQNSIFEDFAVSLTDTDNDVANDTLSVQIVDDVPTANDDAFTIFEGDADNAITFDVDTNDVPGADGTGSRIFTSLVGTYGDIVVNPDGTQTYTLNATGIAAISALAPGATLTDNFSYTLTDGDGDSDPANLVITLQGTDDPPTITGLNPKTNGGDAIVDEDDLADGSDTSKESLTATGDFTITAPDGVNDLTVGGFNVIIDGVFQAGSHVTPLGNTLTFISYNAATGVISYSYTLLDNETHPNANGQNSIFEDFAVVLTDTDNDVANDTLSVQIVDDVPTANDDVATIFEGDADNAITFDVDTNDVPGADGTGSRIFTSLVGTYGNIVVNPDGTQTYTLNATGIAAINALAPGATLTDNFSYTLTDGDGDTDPANLVITLSGTDDPPVITNLTPKAQGGDAIVDEDDLADGSDTSKESLTANGDFTISAPDGVNDLTVGGFNVIIDGVFQAGSHVTPLGNTLTFISYNAATGVINYSYTLLDNETHPNANGQNNIFEDFAVVLTDTDNDVANDTLSVQIVDDVPTANNDTFGQIGENNPVVIDAFANDVFGADGVDIDNNPVVRVTFTQPPAGQGSVSYNPATGLFTFTPAAGQEGQTSFTYTITDGDGDPSTATVTVNLVADSTPIVTAEVARSDDDGLTGPPAGNPASVTGDIDANVGEEAAVNPSEVIFHGDIDVNFGGDTGTISFSNLHNTAGVVGTENVNYTWAGNTLTATTVGGSRPGTALFQIVVNNAATGDYTLTQLDNILHAAGGNETSATVILNYRAADSDGDVDTTGTLTITFNDDAPTLGTVQNQQASNDPTQTPAVGTLHFVSGADGAGSTMTITANNSGITAGGKALVTNQVGNVLTAYQDVGPAGYDAGDTTAVYTITVDPNAGTSGQYTFNLLLALDTTITPIDIGQGSSFGAGPSQSIVVHDTATNQDLVSVTAWSATGGFTPAEEASWLAGNEPDWTQEADVNGSTQGWGRGNNNFDAGEILRFDFGTLDDYDAQQAPDGPYVPPAGNIVNVSFATFTFFNFNDAADKLEFVAHYTNGTTQSFVLLGANNPTSLTITAPSGFNIAWIDAFEQGGSVKINLATVGVNSTTIDETIAASVQLTDGDGDTTTVGNFNIHVATGLVPFAPAAPVVLDLNGDGVHFLGHDAGVTYDYGHGQVATGWVAPDDGILVRDANHNGTVDGSSEFVFGSGDVSDLQALASQYGSTLDANDADFGSFGVWQDANSNGVADAGEVTSLTDAGINSISLSSDGIAYSANNDVEVAGTGSFTRADGSTGLLADAVFLTGRNAAEDQRSVSAANNNTALIAALAAAGVAAAPAAAHPVDLSSASTVAIAAAIVSSNAPAVADSNDRSPSALGGETLGAAGDDVSQPVANASSSGDEQSGGHSLTSANDASPASAPTELIEATDAPAQPVADNFVAPTVAMPSAQALAGATAQDNSSEGAQSTAVVGKVLVDALHGGGAEQSIDALLAALPGHGNGANAAADALASQPVAAVPAWDTGHLAAFTANANFTMEAVALHHDAVQPVANG